MKKVLSALLFCLFIFTITGFIKAESNINLSKTETEIEIGTTYQIEILNKDDFNSIVYESSSPDVCSVDSNGLVKAIALGSAIINIKCDNQQTTFLVGVWEFLLLETEIVTEVGENYQINAISSKNLTYEISDNTVASVNDLGLITALKSGRTTINLSNGIVTKTIDLIVNDNSNPNITVINKNINLNLNQTTKLELSGDLTGYNISYSSNNPIVCVVDSTGTITANGAGTAIVLVLINDKIVDYAIVSVGMILADLILVEDDATIERGQTYQIVAIKNPNTVTGDIKYQIDNEDIAIVNSNGLITALKDGDATITVSCQNISKSFNLKVYTNVSILELESENFDIDITDRPYIKVTSNTNGHTVKYASSNEAICQVSNDGQIIPIAPGEVVINVTIDNITKSVTVLINIKATDFVLVEDSVTLNVGETYQIEYTTTPADATDRAIFNVLDPSIVSVSESGLLTALKEGKTTIQIQIGSALKSFSVSVKNVEPNKQAPNSNGFNIWYVVGPVAGVAVVVLMAGIFIVIKKKMK